MAWFKRRRAASAKLTLAEDVVAGVSRAGSTEEFTGVEIDPGRAPVTEERSAQTQFEFDEFNARREAFQREGQFRGKHFLDWIPELDRLRTEKRDDEALVILAEFAPVTDRAYRAWGEKIGGLAEGRIAVIYRRRKMIAEEVALLEDYLGRHPDHEARDLRARLVKARAILAASSRPASPGVALD